jgi:hypothetical protein
MINTEVKTKVMKKREKKEKVVPTQEQVSKMVDNYIKESSKHLFKVKYFEYYESEEKKDEFPDTYYKVIPVRDETYCLGVTFDSSDVKVMIFPITCSTKKDLGELKNQIFKFSNQRF